MDSSTENREAPFTATDLAPRIAFFSTAIQNKGPQWFAVVLLPSPPVLRGRGVGGEGAAPSPKPDSWGLAYSPSPPTPLPRSIGGEGRKARLGPSILEGCTWGSFPRLKIRRCSTGGNETLAKFAFRWAIGLSAEDIAGNAMLKRSGSPRITTLHEGKDCRLGAAHNSLPSPGTVVLAAQVPAFCPLPTGLVRGGAGTRRVACWRTALCWCGGAKFPSGV